MYIRHISRLAMVLVISWTAQAQAVTWGGSVISRSYVDQAYEITFIDTNTPASVSGKLTAWNLFVSPNMADNDVKLQVFRPVAGGYQLVGQNYFTLPTVGALTLNVAAVDQIDVLAGDVLGFRYDGPANLINRSIVFDYSGDNGWFWSYWPNLSHDVSVGQTILSNTLTQDGGRNYSISAEITDQPLPPTTSVPEPVSAVLAFAGLLTLGASSLRRSRLVG